MTQTDEVLEVFQGFRMKPVQGDQYESLGKPKLAQRLGEFMEKGEPLRFVMLGYPFKSSNDRDKVLGKLPDMAEELSLINFADFDAKIKAHYSKGVEVHIASDGFAFNDLLEVPDSVVDQYAEVTADMGKSAPMHWHTLRSFYPSMSTEQARVKLMEQFDIGEVELQKRILLDEDVNYLYRGMIRFMNEELAIKPFASKTQLQNAAKKLTRAMMLRNEAYSAIVRHEFGSFIRLSMHPSVNNGTKYSFQMIPSDKAWTSPWHGAILVEKSGDIATIHKKDAEAAHYHLVNRYGRPYNYMEEV